MRWRKIRRNNEYSNSRSAVQLIAVTVGSALCTLALKSHFERPRPTGLSYLVDVQGFSYPSGHSLSSTAVYFTFAFLLSQHFKSGLQQIFIFGFALIIILLIALSQLACFLDQKDEKACK